mmetsp:Transcript_955/g.1997  ORF Transcript_955/g.1997 Transcript_955/m.1997 type:complete len:92 (+) Transcript_955:158-433(+)
MTVDGEFGMIVLASVYVTLGFVCQPTQSAMMGVRHIWNLTRMEEAHQELIAHGIKANLARHIVKALPTMLEYMPSEKRQNYAANNTLAMSI